jgi:hypothetical protein
MVCGLEALMAELRCVWGPIFTCGCSSRGGLFVPLSSLRLPIFG